MIKYRACVDIESEWFEYCKTFEEAVQVLRDLFEEDNKVFYNGYTHWTRTTRNGNRSCAVRFVDVSNGEAKIFTHGILEIDTDYKARQEAERKALYERFEELDKLDNKTIYKMAMVHNRELDTRLAQRIMANRTTHNIDSIRRYPMEFEGYVWNN